MSVLRFTSNRSGTAAVEFALLSPLFLLLLMGLIAYGIYFGASSSVQQIAADAARLSVAGVTDTERKALASSFVANHSSGYAFVDPSKLTVQYAQAPQYFTVKVSMDARQLPIWSLLKDLPLPGTTITKQSVVRIGGI